MFVKSLLAIVLIAAVLASDGVSATFLKKAKRMTAEEKETYCAMKMMSCLLPIMQYAGKSQDDMREEVLSEGLTASCAPLTAFSDCFRETIDDCDVPLTEEQAETVEMMIKVTDFICKENLQAINADRECLFGDAYDEAANSQCGEPSVDEITVCQMSTYINCASSVYENVCGNPSLATKFRTFGQQLGQDADCYRTLKLRKLFNEMKALLL